MTLQDFFAQHPAVAVAFSGGVDSAYLLYAARQYAEIVRAYFVRSAFQPQFEQDDALRLAEALGVPLKILPVNVLADDAVRQNPADRCYHCKKRLFAALSKAANADGFSVLLDGTNASDDIADRPGFRALGEFSVLSPLRLCGLTKDEIRRLSRAAGLFTWEKPAYACLATRIPAGEEITAEKLRATEAAENFLFSLGFSDFRVRRVDGCAKIQVPAAQLQSVLEHRERIIAELKRYYPSVLLDLDVRT